MIDVFFIVTSQCPKCKKMKQKVQLLLEGNNIKANIKEYDSESDEAVSLAMMYNLNQVPSMIVNGQVFQSPDFNSLEFLNATK